MNIRQNMIVIIIVFLLLSSFIIALEITAQNRIKDLQKININKTDNPPYKRNNFQYKITLYLPDGSTREWISLNNPRFDNFGCSFVDKSTNNYIMISNGTIQIENYKYEE